MPTGIGGEVAWWCPSLDDTGNGTTTVYDLIGSNNATLINMDAATDWVSDTANGGVRALDFDGTNDYVLAPSFNLPNITFALWVYFTTDVSHVFFAKRTNTNYSWEIGRNAGNDQLLVRINDNANVATGGNLTINTWHHVAGSYNGSSIKAYVDGSLVATTSYATAISSNSTQLTIGSRALFPGAEAFFPLRIDDVRLFNSAISDANIATLATKRGYQPIFDTRRRRYAGGFGL